MFNDGGGADSEGKHKVVKEIKRISAGEIQQ